MKPLFFSAAQLRTALWLSLGLTGVALQSCKEPLEEASPAAKTSPAGPAQFRTEEAFPGRTGIQKKGYLFGRAITYEEIDGQAVFEGDIILPKAQLAETSSPAGRTSAAGRSELKYRWPDNTVYYHIMPDLASQSRVTNAIAHWEANTNLRFVQRTTQPNYIVFATSNQAGCYTNGIGMQTGQQYIFLSPDCSTGNTIHEIGHAVGLFHEATRRDRDQHVMIHWDNVLPGKENNFTKYPETKDDDDELYNGFDHGAFDFESRMLYSTHAFAKDPYKPTISRANGTPYYPNFTQLSAGDIACINDMYPAPGSYTKLPGEAREISVGANGVAYMIGKSAILLPNTPMSGYTISKWNGKAWAQFPGAGISLAVDPSGAPWVVTASRDVFRQVAGQWQPVEGKAHRISIGANGEVYKLGPGTVAGGFVVSKWNGAGWSGLSGTPQGGIALAVSPNGVPWIINDQAKIFRRNGSQWEEIPGKAADISIAPNGAVFVLGNASHNLFKWNGTSWTPQTGTGVRLSVAANERPWIVNEQGEILRRGYLYAKLDIPSL